MNKLKKVWSSYKHRFIPWLFLNWTTRHIVIRQHTVLQRNTLYHVASLKELVNCIALTLPDHYLYRDLKLEAAGDRGKEVMKRCFGFICVRGESSISRGGSGVFVKEGYIPEGSLVAIYPGTLYLPLEPLLLVSIKNQYLLRCYDGMYVDGKSRGVSGLLYRSCANRERVGGRLTCDLSWMGDELVNPLCMGQRVNNRTKDSLANVEYIEMNINVKDMQPKQQRLFPYVNYSIIDSSYNSVRVVGLISTRAIREGEELLSNYFTIVK